MQVYSFGKKVSRVIENLLANFDGKPRDDP
jgi:hypothetical protein